MSYSINSMTSSEIDTAIRELRELAKSGKITLEQADRLSELQSARTRIRAATATGRRSDWG